MRFLLDQSTDARLVQYLREHGHDVTRIGSEYPEGLADAQVLAIGHAERRIVITDDRDFGELVSRHRQPHAGVIYLRLGPLADLALRIKRLADVLQRHAGQLDQFLVVGRESVRVRRG
jgi:predicted nuclease of predicted toxin-antitoxin system